MDFLHGMFVIVKFLFGLGAFLGLIGIGVVLLWFFIHLIVRAVLRDQPTDRCVALRKLFLEA